MSLPQQFNSVEDFVQASGGKRAIKKILLANNGISAVKAMRSIRRWAYDTFSSDRIITFVAMATPEDLHANAEYIRMADEFVEVPGGSNANNYANVQLIISLAVRYQVDAVFAGWGHASENPALPDGLQENNIVFMGPSSGPMFALGDKIGSTIIAQSAGVPVIPWSGDGLQCNYKRDGNISPEVYRAANITSEEECIKAVERVGLPVMIKASEGGGGKGIRKVTDPDQVATAFRQVQNEVPGSPIFVMQVAFGARHLEVQLLADSHGNAVALNGRDCSVQRRHQKILEEGPANSPPAHVWREMERAAVRLAKEVNYCNAGTVEYLYKESDQTFCFLELNPRLQVEHPVTEMITQVNLPAAQLQVAMGLALDRIGDVRVFFQHERNGDSKIDFDASEAVKPHGHCIAARITAENPHKNFGPTSGRVSELNFRSTKNVWAYFSIDNSGNIHEFADSQLGHVFAWGETREEARRNLVVSLKTLTIRGDIRTTVEYLIDLIELEDYKQNLFHTAWLDERIAIGDVQRAATQEESLQVVLIGAACEAHAKALQRESDFLASLERGQMPPAALLKQKLQGLEIIFRDAKYVLDVARCNANLYAVSLPGAEAQTVELEVRQLADGGYLVLLEGVSHVAYLRNEVGARRLTLNGETHLFVDEYDPTVIRAAMGGKIVRSLVEDGQAVKKNAPFCEIEVMKMTMPLMVPEDGRVFMQKHAGSVMQPGDLIARLELLDPTKVKRAERFTGKLEQMKSPQPQLLEPHLVQQHAVDTLQAVMTGFAPPKHLRKLAMKNLDATLLNASVCMLQVRDLFARVRRALPSDKQDEIALLCETYPTATATLALQQEFAEKVNAVLQSTAAVPAIEPLQQLVKGYLQSGYAKALSLLHTLLDQYSAPEDVFAELALSDSAEKDDVMQELRRKYEPKLAYSLSLSHAAVATKNEIAVRLLALVEKLIRLEEVEQKQEIRSPAVALLRKVSGLRAKETSEVALEARQMLIELQHPTFAERLQGVEQALQTAAGAAELAQSTNPVLHMLIGILCGGGNGEEDKAQVRQAALQAYVQRVYQTYKLKDLCVVTSNAKLGDHAVWTFYSEPDAVSFHLQASSTPSSEEDQIQAVRSQSPGLLETSSVGSSRNLRARAGSDQQLDQGEDYAGQLKANAVAPFVARRASLCVVQNGFAELGEKFADILSTVRIDHDETVVLQDMRELTLKQDVQVLHIILNLPSAESEEVTPDSVSDKLSAFLRAQHEALKRAGVRRVTFAVPPSTAAAAQQEVVSGHGSSFFTFRRRTNWAEDRLVRHIEPSLAYQLDLKRLSNFNISRVPLGKRDLEASRTVHVYRATPKTNKPGNMAGTRLFVRALVRQTSKVDGQTEADSYPGPERVLVQAISAIEAVQQDYAGAATGGARNHIFLNVLGEAEVEPQVVERMARHLGRRYAARLAVCRVGQVELRVNAKFDMGDGDGSIPVRIIASNPTGFGLRVDTYVEAADPNNPEQTVLYSISEGEDGGASGALALMGLAPTTPTSQSATGSSDDFFDNDLESHTGQAPELHGLDAQTPYPVSSPLEDRRARALASSTAYCYDFPSIFHKALERAWHEHIKGRRGVDLPSASTMCQFEELVLSEVEIDAPGLKSVQENPLLSTTTRTSGNNTMAMVAWRCTIKTPQYPEGRQFVLIANDITMDAGSFGTQEDNLFLEASKLARALRIPRLYIAANSGARIGMADEVKRCFQVAWVDKTNPHRGFDYLYLSADSYKLLGPEGRNSVICDPEPIVAEDGEHRYKILSIVGEGRDLGVENLRGSGLIAGETSRAYDETFTLTYVAGRSVGIGAYLVRLGQRTIQKGRDAPLLLTGFQALNTLVGAPVYSSNLQLGGPSIMYSNGVSHQCVRNDLEGVSAMLQWLSFVPEFRGANLPITRLLREDPVDREVAYPQRDEDLVGADPRLLLTGCEGGDEWISGLFDRGSFQEYLGGWAKTIITGRARLGGIPVGVVVPECRSVTTRVPADPAQPDSTERVVVQAGNVWYPDSSYKTASAIRDVNREGLPLVFLINIRGFSGGQRDMYDSVLKYGSMIVDALVEFKQPVLVYIPKKSELRGGAWVVVDPTINENVMEMWCDESARGGVLEAAGAASIKFRAHDQLAAAHRLDPVLRELDEQVAKLGASAEIADKIKQREKLVLPVYSQLATEFADAHDRPGRMVAKGVVNGVVPWKSARQFFIGRLKRLLKEFEVAKRITSEQSLKDQRTQLQQIYEESGEAVANPWNKSDAFVFNWLDSPDGSAAVDAHLRTGRALHVAKQVEELGNQDPAAMLRGLMNLVAKMTDEGRLAEREKLVSALRRGVFVLSAIQKPASNGQ